MFEVNVLCADARGVLYTKKKWDAGLCGVQFANIGTTQIGLTVANEIPF